MQLKLKNYRLFWQNQADCLFDKINEGALSYIIWINLNLKRSRDENFVIMRLGTAGPKVFNFIQKYPYVKFPF